MIWSLVNTKQVENNVDYDISATFYTIKSYIFFLQIIKKKALLNVKLLTEVMRCVILSTEWFGGKLE